MPAAPPDLADEWEPSEAEEVVLELRLQADEPVCWRGRSLVDPPE
jgi:hypothetical protein